MPLIKNRYGKGRVRVMRIHRDGDRHEVSQLNIKAMIEGDFARAYTHADNSTSVSTDTIKNVVNVVARENTGLCTEEFCQVLAKKYLDTYPQIASVAITAHETKWSRLSFGGKPHPHSFVLDSNGKPTVEVAATAAAHRRIVVRHRRLCLHEVDAVGLGELRQGPLHHDSRDRRPHVRDQHGGVLEMVGQACELSRDQCKKILDTLLEVFSHDLQQERAGQPVPDGRGGAGGGAGDFRDQHGLPEHAFHPDEPLGVRAG